MPTISGRSIEAIAKMFVGDEGGPFCYLSGPHIVTFFNNYFGFKDIYSGRNAPTRWKYAAEKIADLISVGQIDRFFSIILEFKYMISSWNCSEIEAREKATEARNKFNQILIVDDLEIVGTHGKMKLVVVDSDLVLIGQGGFAEAFLQKSTGKVLKKLLPEVALNKRNRHRFKREYNIMKDLAEVPGVLRVFDFNEGNCSYTMEAGETTLQNFMSNALPEEVKTSIIIRIVETVANIHSRGYIHRDLSPTNIFILKGEIKIADFGLGKNLNALASYQTTSTNNYGQWFYCSPEQLTYLKDGDKRSDVFSLGRMINFILSGHPNKKNHQLRSIVDKATAEDPSRRYQDAAELLNALNRKQSILNNANQEAELTEKVKPGILNEEICEWILEMPDKQLCNRIITTPGFANLLPKFAQISYDNATYIMNAIDGEMRKVCSTWTDYDNFADIAKSIILSKVAFDIKERACETISYIAWKVQRYHAQDLIKDIFAVGIDPMLEDQLHVPV